MPVDAATTAHFNTAPFTLGVTEPSAANTGYGVLGYTPGSLTDGAAATDLVISADNTVVEGQRINGMVLLNANNCTIRGCHIVSYAEHAYIDTSHYGLISTGGTGNVIEYNEITLWDSFHGTDNSGYTKSPPVTGLNPYWPVGVLITGGSSIVRYNNIHDANDLVYMTGGTHQIQGNYLHDNMFRTDDADQSGSTPPSWSHNDGIQVMGGTNHVIDGNSFVQSWSRQTGMNNSTGNPDPYAEQAWPNCHGILMQNANNAVNGVQITRNWFKYGTACVHFTFRSGDSAGSGVNTLTGNRFTPDQGVQFSQYRQIVVDPTTAWSTITADNTNVYSHDPDTPAAVQGLPLNGNPSGNPFTVSTVKAWQYNSGAHTP